MLKQADSIRLSYKELYKYLKANSSKTDNVAGTEARATGHGDVHPFAGRFDFHPVRPGITLVVMDVYAAHKTEMFGTLPKPFFGICMVLEGRSRHQIVRSEGKRSELTFNPGENIITAYPATESRWHVEGGRRHRMVELQIDGEYSEKLIEEWSLSSRHPYASLMSDGNVPDNAIRNALPPALEGIAHQILNCPFEGSARDLFLEAKALEAMAYQLAYFGSTDRSPERAISGLDAEKLHAARRILETEYSDPPSLLQLAHRVGLNDFKLKRGFRELFGTTVFGHVRDLRLQKARALLESGNMNVSEAAVAVGYSCFGHFAAAFKKKFGILPKEAK
jgi:AraC-like DNA-binding protein